MRSSWLVSFSFFSNSTNALLWCRPFNAQFSHSLPRCGKGIEAEGEKILSLPSLSETSPRIENEIRTIVVDGAPLKIDKLGPVVVTPEGLLGSIENWNDLSEQDQVAVMRKIGKRNQERLAALQKAKSGNLKETSL
jgi:hypothetical protein